ncbi:MAG: Crp/Fnr family transcriptional regulator [Deltaproteobacteria bacterium]|nr:Crp/Fnr family transcriptional regulator [Deltaproteobacteria bacterium]
MVQKVAVAQKKLEIVKEINEVSLPVELQNHPLLQGVSPNTLTAIATKFDISRVPRGASIYQVEAPAGLVHLVISGTVRTIHRNAQGETLESDWRQGFSVLGAGELISGSDVMLETAVAAEPVVAYSLPMALVRELITRDVQLLLNLSKALAERHTKGIANERQTLEPAFVRVANYLTTLTNREGKMVAPDLYLVRTTQDDIAAASGLNPRTVSRAMKVLQKKGRLYIRRGEYLLREPVTLSAAFDADEMGE